eukprot:7906827-Alexandrium_andersonii.AAC.1
MRRVGAGRKASLALLPMTLDVAERPKAVLAGGHGLPAGRWLPTAGTVVEGPPLALDGKLFRSLRSLEGAGAADPE